ncbi:hypothetical protein B0T10DRAFT_502819, partial [Thelonectria olida]
NDDLRNPPVGVTRCQVSLGLWAGSQLQSDIETASEAYFRYYADQSAQALSDRGRYATARTHKDIVVVARWIQRDLERDEILRRLHEDLRNRELPPDDKALQGTIDLTARLALMMEVGSLGCSFTGGTRVDWESGSLRECVERHFGSQPALDENVRLEKLFVARNLGRIAGLEILWTENLADHLRLTDDNQKVSIFHHVTFLQMHATSLIPDHVMKETMRTLALLFPQSDQPTRKWLRSVQLREGLDPAILTCGSLRIDTRHVGAFHCWRDRITVLKQVFDDAEPKTISQWWNDRRKGVQWYTFWVAILVLVLTILFGMIQCIEGALQVYLAFKSSN